MWYLNANLSFQVFFYTHQIVVCGNCHVHYNENSAQRIHGYYEYNVIYAISTFIKSNVFRISFDIGKLYYYVT